MFAATSNLKNVVLALLENRVNVNSVTQISGIYYTAAELAKDRNHVDIVEILESYKS